MEVTYTYQSLTIPARREETPFVMLKCESGNRATVSLHDVKQTTRFVPNGEQIDLPCLGIR